MKFIKRLSFKGAYYLTRELNDTHENRHIYYFRLQTIFGETFKLILFLLTIYALGVFIPGIAILIFFSAVRSFAGGYHMEGYKSCLITSLSLFAVSSIVLKYTYQIMPIEVLIAVSFFTAAISLYAVHKWAPQPAYPKSQSKMRALKHISIAIVFAWVIANAFFICCNNKFLILAGCFGMLLADFFLSPISAKIFNPIDRKISR